MRTPLLTALTFLCLTQPVFADDNNTIPMPPAGTTILQLTSSARESVVQDRIEATLRYELESKSATDVQDRINKAMKAALASAQSYKTVQTQTGGYYVYSYNKNTVVNPATGLPFKEETVWRGSQSITLKGADSASLLDLAGKIQSAGFVMGGLEYSVSPEKSEAVNARLTLEALTKLQDKANQAAKALGKTKADLLDVSMDGGVPAYQPKYAMAMMARASNGAMEAAAPVAAPGETEVTMTVSARALLK